MKLFKFLLPVWIPLCLSASEPVQQFSFPLGDEVAEAINEFGKNEKINLSELLGILGVSVANDGVMMFDSPGKGWRFELTTSYENGLVFISVLNRLTFEGNGSKLRSKESVLLQFERAVSSPGAREIIMKKRAIDLKVKEFLKREE